MFDIVYGKSCNLVHFGVLKHVNSGDTVPMRSESFLTTGTAFSRVPLRKDAWRGDNKIYRCMEQSHEKGSQINFRLVERPV